MFGTMPVPNGHFYVREEQGVAIMKIALSNEPHGSGCYGDYYNLKNGLGVKVIRNTESKDPTSFALDGHFKQEITNYIRANKQFPDISPTVLMVMPVEKKDNHGNIIYSPGIVMTHIEGSHNKSEYNYLIKTELKLTLILDSASNDDLHGENYLITPEGKGFIVDWGATNWNQDQEHEYSGIQYCKNQYRKAYENMLKNQELLKKTLTWGFNYTMKEVI